MMLFEALMELMMSQRGKTLMNELLALPAQERQTIAEGLLTSLTTDEYDDALEAELDRRWKEVVTGKIKSIPRSSLKLTKPRS